MTILCFSRDYQADLFPKLSNGLSEDQDIVHIVMNDTERDKVEESGGKVVLVLEREIRSRALDIGAASEILFKIMETTDFRYSPILSDRYLASYDEAKAASIVVHLTKSLEEIFIKFKVKFVMNEVVAIFPSHILLYLCVKYGAKPLFWLPSYVPGYIAFASGIYGKGFLEPRMTQHTEDEAKKIIRRHFEKVREDGGKPLYALALSQPNFIKAKASLLRESLKYMKWRFRSSHYSNRGDYINASVHNTLRWQLACAMSLNRAPYDDHLQSNEESDVFFPIHYEPEAVLLYWAPTNRNQVAFAEQLALSLTPKSKLWLKEHPQQAGALGTEQWKRLKDKYKNIKFVNAAVSSRILAKNTKVTVALSSTAGMDALVIGKKVAVFGDVYYDCYPGAIKLGGAKMACDLSGIRNLIVEESPSPSESEALVEAFYRDFKSHVEAYPFPGPDLLSERSIQTIQRALQAFI